MLRTANNLEVLLHCYVSPSPHPRYDAPSVREALTELTDNGLIYCKGREGNPVFSTTRKGSFMVNHLLSIPLPVEESTFYIPDLEEGK